MKNIILTLMIVVGAYAYADVDQNQMNITIQAKQVSGFDKVTHTPVNDCRYVAFSDNYFNHSVITVGVQTGPAETSVANNTLVRIPVDMLPLKDGMVFQDVNYRPLTYKNGVLTYKYDETGEGVRNHHDYMAITVSPDLKEVSEAHVLKKQGYILLDTYAKMDCEF